MLYTLSSAYLDSRIECLVNELFFSLSYRVRFGEHRHFERNEVAINGNIVTVWKVIFEQREFHFVPRATALKPALIHRL